MKPRERVDRVLAEAVGRDLTSWERHEFLPSIRDHESLSVKQDDVLEKIERRVFGKGGE